MRISSSPLYLFAVTVGLLSFVPGAHAQTTTNDWKFSVGAGVGYAPKYEGSDNFRAFALPVLSAEYQDGLFFANMRDGIGTYPLRGERYKLGASLGYAMGREESDDRKNLRGMGDVDESATANLLGEYDLGGAKFLAKVSTDLSGNYGTTADVKLATRYPLSDSLSLTGSVGTTWADDEHMNNHFGVSAKQSARSGHRRHDADAGFKSVGGSVGANYAVTESLGLNSTLSANHLLGDAADSPISKNNLVPALFVTTSYRF